MFDKFRLKEALVKYKENLISSGWEKEKYKWEAVKCFQDNWDVNSSEFADMLTRSLSKTNNLLTSMNNFPGKMIIGFAKIAPEEVKAMFIALYNEKNDVVSRILDFKDKASILLEKYGNGAGQHYQYENAISTYLWLRYPDKYYIYKYGEIKTVADELGSDIHFKKGGYADNLRNFYTLYNEICAEISKDNELISLFKSLLNEKCYPDPEYRTLTIDVGFYISRSISVEKTEDKNTKISNASIVQWFKPVLEALKTLGGESKPKNVKQQIINDMKLSKDVVNETRGKNNLNKFENDVAWARNYLVYEGYIDNSKHGIWKLTDSGYAVEMTLELASSIFSKWVKIKANKNDGEEVDEVTEPTTFWKISHGGDCISDNEFKIFLDKKIIVVHEDTKAKAQSKTTQGKSFIQNMKKGDFFYLCRGNSIRLFCKVESDLAVLNEEKKEGWYQRTYSVIAESKDISAYKGPNNWWAPNHNSTCIQIKESEKSSFEQYILVPYFDLKINTLLGFENEQQVVETYDEYLKKDFLDEVYMTESRYDLLSAVLKNKKNIILQGAPGVGKTYAAKRLAYSIMGEKDYNRVEFIQFHQNYSYEDFMMGYKPSGDAFELRDGIFYQFCKKANNQSDKDFFFIIDEINRGNMSKIFGELLMLIEKDYRGTKATLAYNGLSFSVPKNLYIIGMMNTADRSLAMIDYALRRRFSFFDIEPGFDSEGFIKYQNILNSETMTALISKICDLNKEIANDKSLGKGFCIGHSYFCNMEVCTDEWLQSVVEFDILPMLSEYWFDDDNKLKRWENILRGVFQ